MKTKQLILLSIVVLFYNFSVKAQNHKYYARAISQGFSPVLFDDGNSLKYKGTNKELLSFFENHEIYVFKKPFLKSSKPNLQRTFYMETNEAGLLPVIQTDLSNIFDFIEYLGNEGSEVLCNYPNDYGQTGPPGTNQGLNVNLGYLDYIGMPLAWDYTTGQSRIKIGLSDGGIVETDDEFVNKLLLLSNSSSNVSHGTTVAGIVAAQGNNSYGITGVCQDCDIIRHGYGTVSKISDLYNAGANVINCSWASTFHSKTDEEVIDEITANGTIIVAAAGNLKDFDNDGTIDNYGWLYYPASYDNVISVGAVGYINDLACENIQVTPEGTNHIPNVKDYVGGSIGFFNNTYDCTLPLENQVLIYPVSTAILNDKVDILGAGGNIFRYGKYLVEDNIEYTQYNGFHTSPTTPQVSGTVALMKTLNGCLSFQEVMSILKITSRYIGNIPANDVYANEYGSGGLSSGNSVKLTHNLMESNETSFLENQKFSRWDFIFNGVSENIIIRNQEFTEGSTLTVNAKNVITLENGTLLEPNENGFTILEIDPNLIIPEDCSSFIGKGNNIDEKKKFNKVIYEVYPTIVDNEMNVINKFSDDAIIKSIKVYDILGRMVMEKDNINTPKILLDIPDLEKGVYILKGYNEVNEDVLTEKFIKE